MISRILERLERYKKLRSDNTPYGIGVLNGYAEAIEIVKEESKNGGCIPCSSGQMPNECEEVDVTIEEIDGDAYTSTSWLQEGVWVVKKTALQPRVIAWKPKSAPYQKGE